MAGEKAGQAEERTTSRRAALGAATFDKLVNKPPLEATVTILLEPALAEAVVEAQEAVNEAERLVQRSKMGEFMFVGDDDPEGTLLRAKEKLADAEDAARAASVELTFRALPKLDYDELMSKCPPTKEQMQKDRLNFDPEKFYPALVAASLIDPKLSVDEVCQIRDAWNQAEWSALWGTALDVNVRRREVDLPKG